jgi:hypothetical protein
VKVYKSDPKQTGFEGVKWPAVAVDRYQWWSLVNTVMTDQIKAKDSK